MNWLELIVSVLAGLVAAIPLVIKLVEYVQKAAKEKNWAKLLNMVISLMKEAEVKFNDGATRKEYVMALVKASADTINYDIDLEAISKMIDDLCDMSNVVNPPAKKAGE